MKTSFVIVLTVCVILILVEKFSVVPLIGLGDQPAQLYSQIALKENHLENIIIAEHSAELTLQSKIIAAQDEKNQAEIYALIELNPQEAAQILSQSNVENRFAKILSLINYWSLSSPASAFDWLINHKNTLSMSEYRIVITQLLKNYAQIEPLYVFSQLRFELEQQDWGPLAYEVAGVLSQHDIDEAFNWLSTLPFEGIAAEYITGAQTRILETYLETQPLNAMTMVDNIEDPVVRQNIAPKLAKKIASEDLDLALSWLDDLPNGTMQQQSFTAITKQVMQVNPDAALNLIIEYEHTHNPELSLMEEAVEHFAYKHPDIVLNKLSKMSEPMQVSITTELVNHWLTNSNLDELNTELSKLQTLTAIDTASRVITLNETFKNSTVAQEWLSQYH